ncbi:hypothetical protein ColTof3_04638 [Colletotrichum tofieldiae]|nr:hypothetical protein ColTof3_04638 [Colletotrichum tofieldiae]
MVPGMFPGVSLARLPSIVGVRRCDALASWATVWTTSSALETSTRISSDTMMPPKGDDWLPASWFVYAGGAASKLEVPGDMPSLSRRPVQSLRVELDSFEFVLDEERPSTVGMGFPSESTGWDGLSRPSLRMRDGRRDCLLLCLAGLGFSRGTDWRTGASSRCTDCVARRFAADELMDLEEVQRDELALGTGEVDVDRDHQAEGDQARRERRGGLAGGLDCRQRDDGAGEDGLVEDGVVDPGPQCVEAIRQLRREVRLSRAHIAQRSHPPAHAEGGQPVQLSEEVQVPRLDAVERHLHTGQQVPGALADGDVEPVTADAGADAEEAHVHARLELVVVVGVRGHVVQLRLEVRRLDLHAGSDDVADLAELRETVAGRLQPLDLPVGLHAADQEHERPPAKLVGPPAANALLREIDAVAGCLDLPCRPVGPQDGAGLVLAARVVARAFSAGAGRQDLVPQQADGGQVFLHLLGEAGGGDAEELAEDDVVVLDELAVLVDELDAGAGITVAAALREVRQVVRHAADERRDAGPVPRRLEHPQEEGVGDAEGVAGVLLEERVGDLLRRDQAIGVDEDAVVLVEDGGREDHLLCLAGIASHDAGGVNGRPAHDEACADRLSGASVTCGVLQKQQRRLTHQANNDYDSGVAGQLVGPGVEAHELVLGAGCGAPMHAGNGTGQDDGARGALPPRRRPGRPEDEKEGEGDDARGHGDERRADDVDRVVDADVVVDGVVAEIVHTADCGTGQDASDTNSPPRDGVVNADGDEGGEEHGDGDEEGQGGEAARIRDLQHGLAVGQVDGPVTDEMLRTCQRTPAGVRT